MGKHCLLIILFLYLQSQLQAQTQHPYILNGSAQQQSCNCYLLTPDQGNASGTVWNKNQINLNNSFDYYFDVYLGCKDDDGADGIAFVLQTQGTNLGSTGQGIGFKGISPSLGVIIDTYQNTDESDPSYDHLAIQMDGVTDHNSPNNLAGPVTALANSDNIEDCQWHILRITWDAVAKQMDVSMDGVSRLSLHKDIVNTIFNGSPTVYWGFGAGIGGKSNVQQFCAALDPLLKFDPNQVFCDGSPVVFGQDSKSFGTIVRWLWNFGDGTTSSLEVPPPHLYAKPGHYEVTMVIEDNSGCVSDTMKQDVAIGSYPVAAMSSATLCEGRPLQIKDASTVDVGPITQWNWDLGNGQTSTVQNPVATFASTGSYPVHLTVTTQEGCSHDTTQTVNVAETPVVSASGENACIGNPITLTGTNETPSLAIQQWYWNADSAVILHGQTVTYTYPHGGDFNVGLYGVGSDGCTSDTVYTPVRITDLHIHATQDTLIAQNEPLQLATNSVGDNLEYTWSPATGLNSATIDTPLAVLQYDQTYTVLVVSPDGCSARDTVNVKVYAGPEFYVPTGFTPNGDGRNDLFRAISPGVPAIDFFMVFDRWGQEVFHTNMLSGAWDGTVNGNPAPVGVYVWMIQGKDYKGRLFSRKGTVTLIR
jgi:gliding motility-associated-like protein